VTDARKKTFCLPAARDRVAGDGRNRDQFSTRGRGAAGERLARTEATLQLVKTGLFLISGGGANSLLRLSANGEILVDGKHPENHAALMSQVRKISRITDMPVRVVILTNHHEDRAGTTAKFLVAGAQIVAQENVANNLTANHTSDEKVALPTITYGRDYTLQLGGIEVQLMHFGNACTNGDTVVYFPNLKVVAVGDLFTPGTPNPDFLGGGSLVGGARCSPKF